MKTMELEIKIESLIMKLKKGKGRKIQ